MTAVYAILNFEEWCPFTDLQQNMYDGTVEQYLASHKMIATM